MGSSAAEEAPLEASNEGAEAPAASPTEEPSQPARVTRTAMHVAIGLVAPMVVAVLGSLAVRAFTVDDSYITFRFAENLAKGSGLVYNVGERIEGYTNFLWTVLLAAGFACGVPCETMAKVLGAGCAALALVPCWLLAQRLRPFGRAPCVATWLLASSLPFTGYAVFGLETALFTLLTLTGFELFCREQDRPKALPWSGLVFGFAALTRPEAPLFFLVLVLAYLPWKERPLLGRAARIRIAAFAVPVVLHLAFRRAYYGAWLPMTFFAKTGDLRAQIVWGVEYLKNYQHHAGPCLWLALGSVAASIVRRRRLGLAIASSVLMFGVYTVLIGADWMPCFRFLVPIEPLVFLLVDDAVRGIFEVRERAATIAMAAFVGVTAVGRTLTLRETRNGLLTNDKAFWDDAAGRTAAALERGSPGSVAVADFGYIGWRTGFPVVDMLGLVTPEIARLPGAYTRKVGPGFADAVYRRDPRYVVLISSSRDCQTPSVASSQELYKDPRLAQRYALRDRIALKTGSTWCIYAKR